MTTSAQNVLPERATQHSTTRRHHRRPIALTAVTVGARVVAVAVADANSSTDDSTNQIAPGSCWS
jgi:3-deoxy-D-arabino-heptulosonate 7-phosphate (DAHP) synthase